MRSVQLEDRGRAPVLQDADVLVAHGQGADGDDGALDVPSELDELVGGGVGHGGGGDPLERLRAVADLPEEGVGAFGHGRRPPVPGQQVEPVQVLPHLARDLLAHPVRVLAGAGQAHEHAARVGGMGVEELQHVALVASGEQAAEELGVARDAHDVLEAATPGAVEQGLEVHRGQARHRLRALDVARHPVERFRHPREHPPIR